MMVEVGDAPDPDLTDMDFERRGGVGDGEEGCCARRTDLDWSSSCSFTVSRTRWGVRGEGGVRKEGRGGCRCAYGMARIPMREKGTGDK